MDTYSANESPSPEAVVDETVVDETVVDEAVVDEAVVDEAVVGEAVVDEAVVDEVVVDEAVVDEVVVDEVVVAEDQNGARLAVRDIVCKGLKKYQIKSVGRRPATPAELTDSTTLTCLNLRSGKVKILDCRSVVLFAKNPPNHTSLEHATPAPGAGIFSEDRNGTSLVVGDIVRRSRKKYQIRDMEWSVSGDGYYTETVTLTCLNLRSGKVKLLEDSEVVLFD